MPNIMQDLGAKLGAEFKAHRLRIENVESGKVDKEVGKQLSSEDFTSTLKTKLDNIESNANNYTLPVASSTVLGGVKAGTNISIDANGVISANDSSIAWSEVTAKPTTIGGYAITDAYTKTEVDTSLGDKVDKVTGKGLSTEDYTTTEKNKLAGIESGAQVNTVTSVAGKTGVISLTKNDVGLSNVDNTSDANKPVSNATSTALGTKVDKVTSTDNAIVRFDGVTGAVQNSGVIIDDSDRLLVGTTPVGLNALGQLIVNQPISGVVNLALTNKTNDAYTYLYNDGNATVLSSSYHTTAGYKPIVFQAGGSERMRIDSAGNVGIGVTPSAWFSNRKVIQFPYGAIVGRPDNGIDIYGNVYLNASGTDTYFSTGAATKFMSNNGAYNWFTAPAGTAGSAITWTQAMILSSAGNLAVGGSNIIVNNQYAAIDSYVQCFKSSIANYTYFMARDVVDTNYVYANVIGNAYKSAICANGNFQSATNSYGSTSDIKLKENIIDTTPKLDKLMQVQVRNFNYIGQEDKQIGVVAQEIEKIFPSIVYETKDTKQVEVEKERVIPAVEEVTEQKLVTEAVLDKEGNVVTEAVYETVVIQEAKPESIEKYTETETVETGETTKNVKYSVIYMMMLKGMQEQQEIINDLKARIEVLESK